jgi:hypothetical protein
MNDVAPALQTSRSGPRDAAVRVALKRAVEALVQYRRDLRRPPAVALVPGRCELVDDIISQASQALNADLLDRSEMAVSPEPHQSTEGERR